MSSFRMNSPVGKAILAQVRGGDYAHPGEEAAIVEAVALLSGPVGPRVLDVGCGRGGTAAWFRRQGSSEVVGVDIDADSIRYARSHHPGIEFLAADVGELDQLALAPFDFVYLLTAFYAFPDQPRALQQIAGACRPGGQLLLVDYTRPTAGEPPPQLGFEIGRPIVLAELTEALSAEAWTNVRISDWTPRFIAWYTELLERFRAQRAAIVATWGEDWYAYVSDWYGALQAGLCAGRLGGAAVTAIRTGHG